MGTEAAPGLKRCIALGDSISIDDYPRLETGTDGIGAASLFHRDLAARFPLAKPSAASVARGDSFCR